MSDTRLYTVPVDGGLPKALPMPVSGGGTFSPDGTKVLYSPLARDFRTWKRYQGGWAQDLFIFDLATSAIEPVAHSPARASATRCGSARRSTSLPTARARSTSSSSIPAPRPSSSSRRAPSTTSAGRAPATTAGSSTSSAASSKSSTCARARPRRSRSPCPPTPWPGGRRGSWSPPALIEDFALSPRGERALFVGRGDVFSAPIEKGPCGT